MAKTADIAIVIPCYNRANVLRRTMLGILSQTVQPTEVILIDDASTDDFEKVVKELPIQNATFRFEVVRCTENRGAPAARNEGAKRSTAPYLIFVDADVELQANALEKMADMLETHRDLDFVYSNFLWGWKKFYGRPFDQAALRRENWIHTTSMMRRSAFPGFDESLKKFQDWDLWLTMGERGAKGFWMDEVLYKVEPKGVMSSWLPRFAYALPWKILGRTPTAIQKYEDAKVIIRKKHHLADTTEPHIPLLTKEGLGEVRPWIIFTLLLEFVSLLTIFNPLWNSVAAILVTLLVFILAIFRPTIAAGILVLELLIGSKGYLLQLGGWPSHTSLRILITMAFLAGWLVNGIQARAWKSWRDLLRGREVYLILLAVIFFAAIRGYLIGNPQMMQDANAWGDWILLLPVIDIAFRFRDRIRKDILPVLVVGICWIAVKTLALEYLFSHGFKVGSDVYLWVRRTGVGEVTLVMGNVFRIFMQSYVYAIIAWIFAFCWWMEQRFRSIHSGRGVRLAPAPWLVMLSSTVILLISLSRSFWIGAALGAIVAVILLMRSGLWRWGGLLGPIAAKFAGIALIITVLFFPVPHVDTTSLFSIFGSRTDLAEPAAASRWNLFPVLWQKISERPILGSGFGATVTYQSKDPRILAGRAGGTYTTYAFEWGWMEHWIKFGIIGIPLMVYLLWSLVRRIWKSEEALWLRVGFVSSIAALAMVHFFTPYLNHPLGFFVLFVGEAIIASSVSRSQTPDRSSATFPQVEPR